MHKITKRNLINCLIRHLWPSLLFSHLSNAQKNLRSGEWESYNCCNTIFIASNYIYLCFREIQGLCELFPLLSDHILILLKSVFKFQKLTRREGGADPFGFSEGKKELWKLWTWKRKIVCEYIEICCGKRASRITQIDRVQSVSHD